MKYSFLQCLGSLLFFSVSLIAKPEVSGFVAFSDTTGKSNQTDCFSRSPEKHQEPAIFNIDTISPNKRKVLEGILEGGYSHGTGDFDYSNYKTSFTVSYHKNPRISLGAGVGFTHYSWGFYDNQFLPALSWHADFRFYPFIKKFSPFLFLRLGYSLKVQTYDLEMESLGYSGSGGIGYRQKLRGKSSLLLRLTYDTQSFIKTEHFWGGLYYPPKTLKFAESIGLTFGWIF